MWGSDPCLNQDSQQGCSKDKTLKVKVHPQGGRMGKFRELELR